MSLSSATYLLVHPRVDRREGVKGERRHSERFVARVGVKLESQLESHGAAHCETVDVSRSGFLAMAPFLPPLRLPMALSLALPDGPLALMGVVVRHTLVGGRPAIGVQLLGLNRERELRWLHAVARLAEARHAEDLVTRELGSAASRPLRPGEYAFVHRPSTRPSTDSSD